MLDPAALGPAPMVVLCLDVQTQAEFNPKYKDVYKYESLGGLHSLLCKSQLSIEYPENPYFKTALADICIGLSDEQALRLAKRHNEVTQFVHKMTHRNLVSRYIQKYNGLHAVLIHAVGTRGGKDGSCPPQPKSHLILPPPPYLYSNVTWHV